MMSNAMTALGVAALALAASVTLPAASLAQATGNDVQPTPFNYVIKDGKPVPKGNRVTNADGSWREEVRQGKCVTVKEGTPQGEVKITRRCD